MSATKDDFVMKFESDTQQNKLNIMSSKYPDNDVEMVIHNVTFDFPKFNKFGTLRNTGSSRI